MRILFLDDDEERHRRFRSAHIGCDVTFCFTYEACIAALAGPRFDRAHLDHDLSDMAAAGMPAPGELNGQDVARFIAGMPPDARPMEIVVHSFNDDGRRKMGRILVDAGHGRVRLTKFAYPPG